MVAPEGTLQASGAKHADEVPLAEAPAPGWRRFAPAVVLALGLLVTFLSVQFTRDTLRREQAAEFDRLVQQVHLVIKDRLHDRRIIVAAIGGLMGSRPQLTAPEFAQFAEQLPIAQLPGAMGFGFIRRVSQDDLPRYLADAALRVGPDFAVRSLSNAAEHGIIELIEPLALNRPARGLDISWESRRWAAAVQAAEQNATVLSGRITLVQDQKQVAGFLLLRPLYKGGGVVSATPAGRWADLVGWTYAPIRIDLLLGDIGDMVGNLVDVEIFEDDPTDYGNLLFDADSHLANKTGRVDEAVYSGRRFHRVATLDVGGRKWYARISTLAAFNQIHGEVTPKLVMFGGLLLSLLAMALSAVSGQTARKAMALADKMTANYRASEARNLETLRSLAQQKAALDEHAIVAITDTQGTIEYANDKFCAISGYSRQEILGQNHRILNSGTHPKGFFQEMYRTIAGGRPWHGEICNRAKDSHLYWVATTIVPFLDANGKPVKYVAIRRDITAQKLAEAELKEHRDNLQDLVDAQTVDLTRARDEALAASRAKSALLNNMSHEFRTPLHGILSYAQLGLQRAGRLTPEKQGKYFGGIVTSARDLMALIEDILDVAKLDAGKARLDLRAADLCQIVQEAAEECAVPAEASKHSIEVKVPAGPVRIMADSPRLRRVLGKLLDNALKFAAAEHPIVIRLQVLEAGPDEAPPVAQVDVEDRGVGIPDEELELVFGKFEESSRTRSGAGGTGLGLPIARMIVESHGGTIWARPNPLGGAILSFRLPLAQSGVPALASTP